MMTDGINNNKVSILETNTHSDVPKVSEDDKSCSIHIGCVHCDICDRSLCLLFFQPGVTWDDLKDAVREWLQTDTLRTLGRMNYGREGERPTDVERFLKANQHLFKTTLAYTVLAFAVTEAVLEVVIE